MQTSGKQPAGKNRLQKPMHTTHENLPLTRRVLLFPSDGSPDLRITVSLRLPMPQRAQWHLAESLPAYSGGTVMELHHLPRH